MNTDELEAEIDQLWAQIERYRQTFLWCFAGLSALALAAIFAGAGLLGHAFDIRALEATIETLTPQETDL